MYKRHSFIIILSGIIVFLGAWQLKLSYKVIASDSMTFVSIAIAVYMAAIALPLGDRVSDYMKNQDKHIPTKTHMGVLCAYLKCAVFTGFISIIISCSVLVVSNITIEEDNKIEVEKYPLLCDILCAIGFSLFVVNMIFAAIIFKYMFVSMINNNRN